MAEGRDGGLTTSGRIGRVGPLVGAARSGATGVSKGFHGSHSVVSAVTSTFCNGCSMTAWFSQQSIAAGVSPDSTNRSGE